MKLVAPAPVAVIAAVGLALAQLAALGRVELTYDEAYYTLWAQHPQAGYLDHPPMVAWTIWASRALFGGYEFGVRTLFWLEGAALPPLIAWIGWRLYGDKETAALAALLFVASPLAAATPLALPDTPLTFFWTLALAALVEIYRGRALFWGWLGFAVGMAGLAKMTAGFLAFGVALALAVVPPLRREWKRPGPYAAGIIALLTMSPFLLWNAQHGYATFLKQGGRLAAPRFAPGYLAEFAGASFALLNPVTVCGAAAAALRRPSAISEQGRLLAATVAPALAYFLAHALHDRVQANWLAPLYPALLLLAARVLVSVPWGRATAYAAAASGLAVASFVFIRLAAGAAPLGPADPLARVGGWRELAVQTFETAQDRQAGFVVAEGYAATALLSFYGPGTPPASELGEPERWTFLPTPALQGAGLAFGREDFEGALRQSFRGVARIRELTRSVGGAQLERYVLFAVEGPRKDAATRP